MGKEGFWEKNLLTVKVNRRRIATNHHAEKNGAADQRPAEFLRDGRSLGSKHFASAKI
jgi:hypothetical protein